MAVSVPGFVLQERPLVYVLSIPGLWLLKHSTPSWRIDDPEKGFQRVVKQDRAQAIAWSVLDQQRSFPNAVVLASDIKKLREVDGEFELPTSAKFLIVDGQHRIWAQKFSQFEADYACMVHLGMSEVEMARLFLEINDNQKRVPSSLRWDLVRLVRPDDDPYAIAAAEMVFSLATNEESPLYQRVDLTGEQGEKELKQGSIAPELKSLLANKKVGIRDLDFEDSYELLLRFLDGIKGVDPDAWRSGSSPYLSARVMRAALRLLPDIIVEKNLKNDLLSYESTDYRKILRKIPATALDLGEIRALQGTAGIKNIYETMRSHVIKG
jgi:DGQHR domain-containing protein